MKFGKTGFNQRRRQTARKKVFVAIFAGLILLSGSYSALALSKITPSVTAKELSIQQNRPSVASLAWPANGQSAIGSEQDGVLATSSQIELQKPMASLTKLITVLAVLEKQPLELGESGTIYTIGPADVANYQNYKAKLGSVVLVKQGQTLNQYQAMQMLLLASANNMADSMAVWVFGSMGDFLTYANQMIRENNWQNTIVADASGFSPANLSTPSDLIKIGQTVLQNQVLAEIVQQKQASIPGIGLLQNTNLLLNDADAAGIKTGTTDEAGSCLLFAVKHGPNKQHIMIGAVMGQPNWPTAYTAVRALRDSALTNFKEIEVLPAGLAVGQYQAPWGQSAEAITKTPLNIYGWAGKPHQAKISLDPITVPRASGSAVGHASITSDDSIAVDLVTSSELKQPNIWWKLRNFW